MKNKLLLLVCLLTIALSQAQIVNIPDTNFKAKLLAADATNQIAKNLSNNFFKIDANNDGEIQESEALEVTFLNLSSSNIIDLEGIGYFINLKTLNCNYNNLVTLDLSTNTNLELVNCIYNSLTQLNLINNVNLKELRCDHNNLTTLNIENSNVLENLTCNVNELTSLFLGTNDNLDLLWCRFNNLTSLNLDGVVNLNDLDCRSNQISNLDVSQALNLFYLDCSENSLTDLDLTQNINIEYLYADSNNLTSLDVANLSELYILAAQDNEISSINLSNNDNLSALVLSGNPINSLDLSNNIELGTLYINNSQLTNLDISNNSNLFALKYANNPNLVSVNQKNGVINTDYFGFQAEDNPSLQFVCVDENNIVFFNSYFETENLSVNVNSYCSFAPNGDYNEIRGVMTYDFNENGCDLSDTILPAFKININDFSETSATFTNSAGEYSFYTQEGDYTISPQFENPTYFISSPVEAVLNFADSNNNVAIQDFCITPNGVHNDLEIVLASTVPARPGFDAEYLLVYKNKGNQILSGNVSFTYNEDVLDYIASTEVPTTQTAGVLNWNYVGLLPFESRSVSVTLNVNSPMEIPAVNIDDVLNFIATINPVDADDIPEDNQFNLEQVVIGAYDPNDITCLEGVVLEPSYIGKYLHYLINFENTGNAPAENIVVAMNVDTTLYDLNSLELLNSSHASEIRVNGDKVEFIFESIFLEALGKGHLVFKIKSQETLQVGDTVTQHAEIFFDFNFPVVTNTASTTFAVLSTLEFSEETPLAIFPNPFGEVLTIKAKEVIRDVEIYDVQGRVVFSKKINNTEAVLNIPKQSQGVYFAKITTDKGVGIEKIIKK